MVELTALQRERVRRSQRVSVALPVLVTSLDPESPYSEHCFTFVVNAHGCGLRAPRPISPKTPVQLEVGSGKRTATARVVMCEAVRGEKDLWELGIELDVPSNLWGFHFPPSDWIVPMQIGEQEEAGDRRPPAQPAAVPAPGAAPPLESAPSSPVLESPASAQPQSISLAPASPPLVSAPQPTLAAPVATMQAAPAAPAAPEKKGEVSFSLAEMRADASSEVAPAPVEPVAPPAAPPERPEVGQEFARGLRDTARKISAEFQEEYRRSLGELLARLRADLEGQATDDWTRILRQAEERLQAVAAGQFSLLQQEQRRHEESQAQLDAKLEELNKLRDYVESLLRTAPQTLERHLEESSAGALAEIRPRLEQELAAAAQAETQRLEQHLQAVLAQAAEQTRQTLLDDFDRHEREFLDRIAVRLEEVRASADHTRQFTARASADVARQTEQLRVDLQTQFDSLFEQQRHDLAGRLEDRHQLLSQAAHTALQNLGGRLWSSLQQQLNADFENRNRALQQTLQKAQAESRRLEERTEKLAARLDTDLEARLDHAVEDTARRAQSRLQPLLEATQEDARRRLQAEREQFNARDERERQALAESLCAQRAQLLAEFKHDSESIAADCLARYQTAMRETLESIEEVLRSKLRLPGETSQP